MSHETHNLALECNYHDCVSRNTESHHNKERNYYDNRVVRSVTNQRESSIVPPNFHGTYDPYKFCDWIAHLDYYFDLYEFFDASRVRFATCISRSAALDY